MSIQPKGKKVTGTKKKDKITWVSSKAWKKALTVNAGNGNDVINFKKSKYKNKLNGQAGNDKIYAGTNDDIIHGNAGNDLIYGYNGNDKLYGDAGKDKLFGGNGNDSIWGGKGNDIIDAGLGKNTIYFNKGDGKDTVLNGKGIDTLVFASETTSTLSAKFSGNNLIITSKNGKNTVTLKDYAKGDHSAQWTTIGKITVRTDSLVAKNNVTPSMDSEGHKQYTGTPKPDNIFVNDYDDNTIVNALAGDDYIEITGGNYSYDWAADEIPYIDAGSGNDTISLNLAKATVKIDTKSGSDTIVNAYKTYEYGTDISWGSSSGYTNSITLDFKGNENLILRYGIDDFPFIAGQQKGNDLIIKLTNGETITLKDYYTVDHSYSKYETNLDINGSYYSKNVENFLQLNTGNIVNTTLTKTNNKIDLSKSNDKNIIVARENANYTIKAGNGDNNEIGITADGNHNIEVGNGINNTIVVKKGTFPFTEESYSPIKGNVTIKTGNWTNDELYDNDYNNQINVMVDGKANITTGTSENDIYIEEAKEAVVNSNGIDNIYTYADKNTITSNNSSKIQIGSYYSEFHRNPVSEIYSNGYDTIKVYDGEANITLSKSGINAKSGEKVIENYNSDSKIIINGIFNADKTAIRIYDKDGNYGYGNDYVFTHYYKNDVRDTNGNGTGYITIHKLDNYDKLSDESIQINGNYVTKNGINYFDLAETTDDYEAVIDDYLELVCGSGTPYRESFSSMKQYIDMDKLDDNDGTDIYDHEFSYYDDALYDICSGVYVKGSTSNDKYNYDFDDDGNVTINDQGGNDRLTIYNNTSDFKFFYDIKNDGTVGKDLIFTASSDYADLFSYTTRNSVRCLTIKDYFTDSAEIEVIQADYTYYGTDFTEYLSKDTLIKTGTFSGGTNTIIADVVAWLNAHDKTSVSSVINTGYNTDIDKLIKCYTSNEAYSTRYWTNALG